MSEPRPLRILPQPDDSTCGPTCLHAVYRYFGDDIELEQVVHEAPMLDEGGTLAVNLGCHALERGYRVTIYTYNLEVFDPTWFSQGRAASDELLTRLVEQAIAKASSKLRAASAAYIKFLKLGGQIRMQDLDVGLIRRFLKRSIPILTGLSSTYLYQSARERPPACTEDDIRGVPMGHFVVLHDWDPKRRVVQVADPYLPNPLGDEHYYEVRLERLVCSILLGVLTYDANLLIVEPKAGRRHG